MLYVKRIENHKETTLLSYRHFRTSVFEEVASIRSLHNVKNFVQKEEEATMPI